MNQFSARPLQWQRVPVVAIVDTANLRGQVADVLGTRRHATVTGMVAAFRRFGFELLGIHFVIATDAPQLAGGEFRAAEFDSVRRRLQRDVDSNREWKRLWQQDHMATVHDGVLLVRPPNHRQEEKLVDVQCAVQICRSAAEISEGRHPAAGIVVVSEDMDLQPAYAYARELGVPLWVAANDTVHTRSGKHDWVLLDDRAIALAVGFHRNFYGSRLRGKIATALVEDGRGMPMTVEWKDDSRGEFRLRSPDGLPATIDINSLSRGAGKGTRHRVHVVGVELGAGGRGFPVLRTATRRPDHIRGLVAGTVVAWADPTAVYVDFDHRPNAVRLSVPVGHLLPGMRILAWADRRDRPRYVGPLDTPPPTPAGWPEEGCATVRLTSSPDRGVVETTGRLVRVSALDPVAGCRYPCFLVDHRPDEPLVMTVGSALSGPDKVIPSPTAAIR